MEELKDTLRKIKRRKTYHKGKIEQETIKYLQKKERAYRMEVTNMYSTTKHNAERKGNQEFIMQ